VAVAGTLVAGREPARAGELHLEQDDAWTSIQVHRCEDVEAEAAKAVA
jgi:hypothetical protein